MSITAMFARLGAPLANVQWSWGGLRADGAVFLRVWQDQTQKVDDKRFIRLAHHSAHEGDTRNLGYQERLRHLMAVKAGAPAFAILVRAKDVKARPRSIAGFNDREVFQLGEIATFDGDEWGELKDRISVQAMAKAS
ncbi:MULTISPECIES: hypothetical protein [unclassified Novosphingobium]|uniref:hypothetical protein n=1 Tax=unclassified Novosphingobium TaxID=2644732 RepID=UPI0025D14CA3|nr:MULTISPECIES: hypothetical protein [unclassified Novosphingobium]